MSALFSQAEVDALGAPHVGRAWFAELELPSGTAYLHSGVGTVVIDGQEWRGVSYPVGGPVVAIDGVRDPQFGQAAAVTITLSGASLDFIRSVHATRRDIEGKSANIYWCAFDGETQQPIGSLKGLFTRGYMSAPTITWQGLASRTVSITIENIWSATNFKPGRRWTPSGQRALYPGDKGLDFVGVRVSEAWQ